MKFKVMLSLTLMLALWGAAFAQEHQGPGSQNRTSQVPQRSLADLVKNAEAGLENIKQAVGTKDVESVDQAVSSYISTLGEIRDAIRVADPEGTSLDKDLARVERLSRTNLESLADLRKTALVNLFGSLEDATSATRETYVEATDLRDRIAGANGSHHGSRVGRGSCGYGSRSGCGGRGRGWGLFSRWRGC